VLRDASSFYVYCDILTVLGETLGGALFVYIHVCVCVTRVRRHGVACCGGVFCDVVYSLFYNVGAGDSDTCNTYMYVDTCVCVHTCMSRTIYTHTN